MGDSAIPYCTKTWNPIVGWPEDIRGARELPEMSR